MDNKTDQESPENEAIAKAIANVIDAQKALSGTQQGVNLIKQIDSAYNKYIDKNRKKTVSLNRNIEHFVEHQSLTTLVPKGSVKDSDNSTLKEDKNLSDVIIQVGEKLLEMKIEEQKAKEQQSKLKTKLSTILEENDDVGKLIKCKKKDFEKIIVAGAGAFLLCPASAITLLFALPTAIVPILTGCGLAMLGSGIYMTCKAVEIKKLGKALDENMKEQNRGSFSMSIVRS